MKPLAGLTILFAVIVILGVDLFIVLKWGYSDTVSAFLNKTFREWPIVTFMFGVVCGHFIWPIAKDK